MGICKVFVLTGASGVIIAINSGDFILDHTGWVQIDEGDGDRYMHAQGNYLPKPLMDDQGRYRYKLVEGAVVERIPEELADDVLPAPQPTLAERNRADIDFLAMMGGVEL